MFISIAVLFIILGILILLKAFRMPREHGLHIITGLGALLLIISGGILAYYLLSGKIVLPIY